MYVHTYYDVTPSLYDSSLGLEKQLFVSSRQIGVFSMLKILVQMAEVTSPHSDFETEIGISGRIIVDCHQSLGAPQNDHVSAET
jgi:hypothetical protein